MIRQLKLRPQYFLLACVMLVATAVLVCVAGAQQSAPGNFGDGFSRDASRSSEAIGDTQERRLREGTEIENSLGHFVRDGDGAIFVRQDGLKFGGLPNLNLERVARLLKSIEQPDTVSWTVSGIVTEFGGRNFLLIKRAVYKSESAPPPPEQLAP